MIFKSDCLSAHIKKYIDIYILILLFCMCYIFLFHQTWHYSLIDVDETRYASMAREILQRNNWLTMYLNGDIFYEKPPLYFWMLATSYLVFGKVSEFTARFPIALIASLSVYATYLFGKKTISRSFGLISSLILLSSVEFLILSRIAILDIVVSTLVLATIYSGFMTYFCKEENKKYFWWGAYIFSALAVLAKGLPGAALPFMVLTFTSIITGNFKQMLKPINLLPGIAMFFIIALPWHIMMFNLHGMDFINDYFIKHHFARFLNTDQIGRVEPFYYFVPVLFVGFFPWIFTFIGFLIRKSKDLSDQFRDSKSNFSSVNTLTDIINFVQPLQSFGRLHKLGCDYHPNFLSKIKNLFPTDTNSKKLITVSTAYFLIIFGFFSFSNTKLPTYILPLFPALSLLAGYYWYEFIANNKNALGIKVSTLVLSIICLISGLTAPIVLYIIKSKITSDITSLIYIAALWLSIMAIALLILIYKNKKTLLFSAHIIFMMGVILIAINYGLPVFYNGGENSLIKYAKYAKSFNNSRLITFNFGVRPSTLYYYDKKVHFLVEADYKRLKELSSQFPNTFIIVKTRYLDELKTNIKYNLIKKERKYSLISSISFIK